VEGGGRVNRSAPETRRLVLGLSALAGFVDAAGYLTTGGFFVSFMSGNSTRFSVGLVTHGHDAVLAALLILAFVTGVVAGSLLGMRVAGPRRGAAILVLLTVLLLLAAFSASAGWIWAAALLAAMAMGSENAVFARDGQVALGLTYMTGTLVRCGERIAHALNGGERWGWLPPLFLWLGLAGGAVAGALLYAAVGALTLWLAAGAAAAMTLAAIRIDLS
jgi:uncharacterized membrane protein YoaK (UPF0700 family)